MEQSCPAESLEGEHSGGKVRRSVLRKYKTESAVEGNRLQRPTRSCTNPKKAFMSESHLDVSPTNSSEAIRRDHRPPR